MPESPTPLAELSAADLEQALRDLGRHLAYPATPDLTQRVRAALQSEEQYGPRRPSPTAVGEGVGGEGVRREEGTGRLRITWLAAAAILIALLGTLALFPQVRTAIADRLGLSGVQIRWVEEAPTPPPSPAGASLGLGRPVTLEEARAAVDFPLLLPTHEGFANPIEIYLLGQGDDAMVSFVYPAGPDLPATGETLPSGGGGLGGETGVGALLTQFRGRTERGFIEKGLMAEGEEGGTHLEAVNVGRSPGYWISGAPHGIFLVCHDDDCREERYRLAGNVLLWERDGVTFRLESALFRDAALAIAASIDS